MEVLSVLAEEVKVGDEILSGSTEVWHLVRNVQAYEKDSIGHIIIETYHLDIWKHPGDIVQIRRLVHLAGGEK